MLACSFCGSVQSPDWWTAPLLLVPVALAVLGVALLSWATRVAGRARVGGLCLAAALIVPLPLGGFGTVLLVTADRRRSVPGNDDSPRPEPGAVDHTGVR